LASSVRELFASRSKRIIVATVAIIALLCASAYVFFASLPSQMRSMVTLTSSPFELSVSLGKAQYSLTENMSITFYLRNISNKTITVEIGDLGGVYPNTIVYRVVATAEGVDTTFPVPSGENIFSGLVPFDYTLFLGNGSVLDKFPYGPYSNEAYSITFQPNASLNQTLYIDLAEYTPNRLSLIGRSLQKGTYQITGAFIGSLDYRVDSTWETPPITLTLG
jgi:hypothetical protein